MDALPLLAVIFDMDGVITATIHLHYESWKKVLEEFGLAFTPEENDRLRSLTRGESLKRILGSRQISEEDRQAILYRKNIYYLERVERLTSRDLLPGVDNLIRDLRNAGIRVGVASASSNTQVVLSRLGILDLFRTVIDANQVSISKPSPLIYLRAAQTIGAAPPSCLGIEDSDAGIEAVHSAGMCAIGVGKHVESKLAAARFPDLSSVNVQRLSEIHLAWVTEKHSGRS